MSKLKHLPADADVKSIVAAVKQDGAVILDNVISKEFIAALREETDPYMDQTCLLYTSPSPRDATLSRMPSSA